MVRDLGSRNGTLVNGKALTADCRLKDRDLVQVGPLTFAVSISEAPRGQGGRGAGGPGGVKAKVSRTTSRATRSTPGCSARPRASAAEKPTVYGGDTITITAFKDAKAARAAKPQPPPSASDDEYERRPRKRGAGGRGGRDRRGPLGRERRRGVR